MTIDEEALAHADVAAPDAEARKWANEFLSKWTDVSGPVAGLIEGWLAAAYTAGSRTSKPTNPVVEPHEHCIKCGQPIGEGLSKPNLTPEEIDRYCKPWGWCQRGPKPEQRTNEARRLGLSEEELRAQVALANEVIDEIIAEEEEQRTDSPLPPATDEERARYVLSSLGLGVWPDGSYVQWLANEFKQARERCPEPARPDPTEAETWRNVATAFREAADPTKEDFFGDSVSVACDAFNHAVAAFGHPKAPEICDWASVNDWPPRRESPRKPIDGSKPWTDDEARRYGEIPAHLCNPPQKSPAPDNRERLAQLLNGLERDLLALVSDAYVEGTNADSPDALVRLKELHAATQALADANFVSTSVEVWNRWEAAMKAAGGLKRG